LVSLNKKPTLHDKHSCSLRHYKQRPTHFSQVLV
jgi:hypothetical protein